MASDVHDETVWQELWWGAMVHPGRMMDNMIVVLTLTAVAVFGTAVLIGYLF